MKFLNFFDKLGDKFGKMFKLIFTIFAGVVTLEAIITLDGYESYLHLLVVVLLYGFPCFLLWSGLLGGEKTASVIVTMIIGYHVISRCNGSFYIARWNNSEGYIVYNLYSLLFDIAVIIGIGVGLMFICSMLFRNVKIFKILATIFATTSVALFTVVWVLIWLMVFKVGEISFKWTNIITVLDSICVYPLLVSALYACVGSHKQNA